MTDEVTVAQAVADADRLIGQAELLIAQARRRLQVAAGQEDVAPYLDAKTAARVAKLGEVAHRHKEFIDRHGSMTRAESLAIRRQMFGASVQATANLFGTAGSGALFWRDRPNGTPVRDDDPIRLTDEGTRIAELWQAIHRAPSR
jgi:hypothetical protein